MCKTAVGLTVPTPTFPLASTINEVAVEEPITNDGEPPTESIES